MRRLICVFVIRKWQKTVFAWPGLLNPRISSKYMSYVTFYLCLTPCFLLKKALLFLGSLYLLDFWYSLSLFLISLVWVIQGRCFFFANKLGWYKLLNTIIKSLFELKLESFNSFTCSFVTQYKGVTEVLHICSKRIPVCFSLGDFFARLGLVSTTHSWSDKPGIITFTVSTRVWLVVKNKSRILPSLVGSSTIWMRLYS